MIKAVKCLSRLLNASCGDVITVPLFFSLPREPPPLPKLFWHSCKMAARNGKRSISMILRKKEDCEQTTIHIVLVVYIVSFYPCSKIHFPLISNSLSEITIRLPFRIFHKKKCNVVKDKLNHSVKHSYGVTLLLLMPSNMRCWHYNRLLKREGQPNLIWFLGTSIR